MVKSAVGGRTVVSSEWAGIRWPVFQVTIAESPPLELRPAFRNDWPPGGLFVWAGTRAYKDGPTPVEAPPPPRGNRPQDPRGYHGYNPFAFADALLRAAVAVDNTDAALLAFVNAWGLLGVGLDGGGMRDHPSGFDSVEATRQALRDVQRHVRWLDALSNRRWNSRDLPTLPEAREVVSGTPARLSARDYPKIFRLAFSASLTARLHQVHPTIRWDRDAGPAPAWTASRLIDVLWATIWDWATRGGHLRRCPRCKAYFPREHGLRKFCSRECANRASAAAAYERRRQRQRRRR